MQHGLLGVPNISLHGSMWRRICHGAVRFLLPLGCVNPVRKCKVGHYFFPAKRMRRIGCLRFKCEDTYVALETTSWTESSAGGLDPPDILMKTLLLTPSS